MNFEFSKDFTDFLKIITKTAQENNLRVFFVGGLVRDNYLKKEIKDVDLILEGNALDFAEKLPKIIKIKSIHKDFGTVKLEHNNQIIDLASTRTEKYQYSGSLPTIIKLGVTIEEDVKRRDFTVNSLYAEIKLENNELSYNLIDLVNGINDIEEKNLKVLHKKSYIDDPTRILRGLNFKYRFNFEFSSEDKTLINEFFKQMNLENASIDRIKDVFGIILSNSFQDKIFNEIVEKKYYLLLKNSLDIDLLNANKVLEIFKLNQEEKTEFYLNILNGAEYQENFKTKIEEYKYYQKLKNHEKAYIYCKNNNSNIINYSKIKIFTTGKDLINLGYKSGKLIGEILDSLIIEKLNNNKVFQDKNDEIAWVKKGYPIL